ncbi:MAG: sigma-70 family RNA polymerase sigma factor [bacterium]|nr:sigma-70 family RNA polymerase sigma factor [bacterium]
MRQKDRTTASDAELVEQVLAGSSEAFRQLVERFQRPVLSVIARMVGDPALAEDLAQEAFIKAYRALGSFDPRRKLASWLFKIAHNTTIDHLRRGRPETVPLEPAGPDDEESWEVLAASEDEGPQRRAEQAQLVRGLDAALGRLAPRYREILLLRFQQGLAYHEIAEVTGLAMGTVKVHLHRARKLLAAELAAAGFVPPERWREKKKGRA